jgi:hypothetical protein
VRRRAIIGALLLIGVGVIVGATVFRTDIAQATGLAQSVTVDNTSANPVPVREQNLDGNGNVKVREQGTVRVDAASTPARDAFERELVIHTLDECFTVPTRVRLVIQEVSGTALVDTGESSGWVIQVAFGSNPNVHFYFTPDTRLPGEGPGFEQLLFSEPTTIYADGGSTFCALDYNGDQVTSTVAIAGYTVPMP